MSPMEYWTCYGYCIILASTILTLTMILHQGLRILSVPSLLHHIVNLASISLFYGPQRTLALFFTTIMRIVMVMPPMDDQQQHQEQQQQSGNSMMGCSFLLLSLWVFMPLFSWIRTSTLFREVELCVTRADPVDFETALRKGRAQLKHWYWEQLMTRYLLLSMYSALVLWESSSQIKIIK